ncbi:MAG: hypothetical protein QM405_06710 [Euryarchaeota archaeon]|nr:hypothetical protein [Euryarchaeota archaeon]
MAFTRLAIDVSGSTLKFRFLQPTIDLDYSVKTGPKKKHTMTWKWWGS